MIVAGVDYSMTSPAICILDDETPNVGLHFYNYGDSPKKCKGVWQPRPGICVEVVEKKEYSCPEQRYEDISNWALNIILKHNVEKVVIEGYSMGSSSGLVFNIAENTGLLKYKLWKAGIKVFSVPPSQVKKTFTGKGNAKKEEMALQFKSRFGFEFCEIWQMKTASSPSNDLVDSYAIARSL